MTNATIKLEYDRFARESLYILRCPGVLNGTPMGRDYRESRRGLNEINIRRESLGLPTLVVAN